MIASTLKKNLAYAFGAESLQLLQSVLMSLIIPKILGVEQFGFWQLFIFYTSYGGFFHLGLLDGIYLKIGGKYREELDFSLLAKKLKILIFWVCLLMTPLAIWGSLNNDRNRAVAIIASAGYIIFFNIFAYHTYILQCVNNIKAYSIGRFIDMSSFIIGLLILLFEGIDFFIPYVVVYCFAKVLCLFYYAIQLKELWVHLFDRVRKSDLMDVLSDIRVGINLMISNIASMLVLGLGRWMVDNEWGIESFGKISFSLIFVHFFLMFIQQASMVLFPDLRRRDPSQVNSIYQKMTKAIMFIIPVILVMYMPFSLIIKYWLPAYTDSIFFLVFLLPLCCFETKMALVYNTMFKVVRLEKKLLLCNVLSVCASACFLCLAIYIFKTLSAVVIAMFFAVFFRCVLAEFLLENFLFKSVFGVYKDLIPETLILTVFILLQMNFSFFIGWLLYLGFTLLFLLLNFKSISLMFRK